MRTPNPHHVSCPVSVNAHPLAKHFFRIAENQQAALTDIAERAGVSLATMVKWKTKHAPTVTTLQAALNVLGYDLRAVKVDEDAL